MWYITCLNEWKHFRRQFSIFVSTTFYLIVYLFCLYFCFLWHFEIINSIVNSLIATSMYFLCRCNWKEKTWQVLFWTSKFGRPNRYTSLPNYLDTSLAVWNIKPADLDLHRLSSLLLQISSFFFSQQYFVLPFYGHYLQNSLHNKTNLFAVWLYFVT